jgi:hypothetical protein
VRPRLRQASFLCALASVAVLAAGTTPAADRIQPAALAGQGTVALRPAGGTSADAAALPILPGLLNFAQIQESVRTGQPITHAIRFTAQVTAGAYIWPARHEAGSGSSATVPPMGARV